MYMQRIHPPGNTFRNSLNQVRHVGAEGGSVPNGSAIIGTSLWTWMSVRQVSQENSYEELFLAKRSYADP